jgi:glycosyltransferase involved in cell wall biosynthesis
MSIAAAQPAPVGNTTVGDTTDDETTGQPFVSIIIPHYNDLDGLRLCHARLMAQSWPRSGFEIVVADNNSRCGLAAVQEAAPTARVVPAPIQGAGPARNAGVAASRGAILAFTDSDCVPEPDWLREGLAGLSRFDFVGGQVLTLARDPARPNPVEAFEIVFNFNFRRYIEKVGFTGTGNLFVPRAVFDRVGPFGAGMSEDMEWCFRARSRGFRIGYAERAVVGHPARQTWAELRGRWVRMISEHYGLALMRPGGRLTFALKALAMPLSVLPHAVKVLASDRLPNARARLEAIGVLARLRLWRTGRMLLLASGMAPGAR